MIIGLDRVRATDIPLAGGKGANLAEMTRLGLPSPAGSASPPRPTGVR